MYEGQPFIRKDIIEEYWLEYLAYVKKRQIEEQRRNLERQKLLEGLDDRRNPMSKTVEQSDFPMYFDIGANQFWSWYINNKVEVE